MQRITSVDAFRGFVMFLLLAQMLRLPALADKYPDCPTMQAVKFHTSHIEWVGCSLHDMIQPGFTFLVGVALTFSLARRQEQPVGWRLLHAGWRSLVLVWLGVFLRSLGQKKTNFTFEDTLSQIGLGYLPLVLLALFRPRVWLVSLVVILVGYWALFAFWPLPPDGFDRTTVGVGVKTPWPHDKEGFEAHWNLNRNPAAEFDAWLLSRLRDTPVLPDVEYHPDGTPKESYKYSSGNYATLSFIPTLGTMLLGLFAGRWLQGPGTPLAKAGLFVLVGIGLLIAGYGLGAAGVCPVIKKIWTPSWVLVSGGYCFLMLAAFHATTDAIGYGGWSYPLRVIGANSILAYILANGSLGVGRFVRDSFQTHLGADVFGVFDECVTNPTDRAAVRETVAGATTLIVFWLALWWLYTRKVFIRV